MSLRAPAMAPSAAVVAEQMNSDAWLARFHAGAHEVMEECYRTFAATVTAAVRRPGLSQPDRETLVHEVFYRMLSDPAFRRSFQGGSLGAWLSRVASNHAIDFMRRHNREVPLEADASRDEASCDLSEAAELRVLLDKFRRERLPRKWAQVFELRFVQQLEQQDAARRLGVARTTLAYQEHRVRSLLQRFFLEDSE